MAYSPLDFMPIFSAMTDLLASIICNRPCQLVENWLVLQTGHSLPSINILHLLQTFFFILLFYFFSFLYFASLGSFSSFFGALFSASSFNQSNLPRPCCLIVNPSFGLSMSLNETAIILALHTSPTFRILLLSFPVSVLSLL